MYENQNTPTWEALYDLKAEAQLMQDELSAQGAKELRETGRLNSPRLCEKAREFERFMLSIRMLEERLEEMDEGKATSGE